MEDMSSEAEGILSEEATLENIVDSDSPPELCVK